MASKYYFDEAGLNVAFTGLGGKLRKRKLWFLFNFFLRFFWYERPERNFKSS